MENRWGGILSTIPGAVFLVAQVVAEVLWGAN